MTMLFIYIPPPLSASQTPSPQGEGIVGGDDPGAPHKDMRSIKNYYAKLRFARGEIQKIIK